MDHGFLKFLFIFLLKIFENKIIIINYDPVETFALIHDTEAQDKILSK